LLGKMSALEVAEGQTLPAKTEEISVEARKVKALGLLSEGKRHLLCKDIPAAVSSFTQACEKLSTVCGEKSPECGEAYFYYGKALLEMTRLPSTLQLAREVLELSKLICNEQLEGGKATDAKDTRVAMENRLFDTYYLLSEISLETGNYGQAVEDLQVCLERQKAVLQPDCRDIAVTHYQLGVALEFDKKYDEAIVSLDAAVTVLVTKMFNLKKETDIRAKMEVKDIEELIPEIKAKIVDILNLKEVKVDVADTKGRIGSGHAANAISM